MGRGKALTDQEYWWIIGLHDGGVSVHEIARRTGRSRTCVRKAIKKERGPQSDGEGERPRSGRRPALTEREVRQLVRSASTGNKFAAELKAELRVKASVRTVQRLLQRVDHLVYTKMDRTLPLTTAHKTARMCWAEKHILNPGIWKYTVFSDEKKFNLDGPDGSSTTGVTCVSQHSRTFVDKMAGEVSWCGALLALKERASWRSYGAARIQQDNASIHASRETTSFLVENKISTMVWPARSPDCNPIENVWSVLAARVYSHGRQYRSVIDLEAAILLAWDSIEQEYLLKLVKSMPRRCLAVIKQKGGLTKY